MHKIVFAHFIVILMHSQRGGDVKKRMIRKVFLIFRQFYLIIISKEEL